MDSYGYIETFGYVASIVAADAALKAANVTLTNCYFVTAGIVTVELTGDVAAVRAAVEAGSESAKQLGNFLSNNVIARVDEETKKILFDGRDKNTNNVENKNEAEIIEKIEIELVEKEEVEIVETIEENTIEVNSEEVNSEETVENEKEEEIIVEEVQKIENLEEIKTIQEIDEVQEIHEEVTEESQENIEQIQEKTINESHSEEKDHIKKLKKEYQETRVIELKMKVNNLKLGYTWNQIKGMTKKKLIEILIKNNQEE